MRRTFSASNIVAVPRLLALSVAMTACTSSTLSFDASYSLGQSMLSDSSIVGDRIGSADTVIVLVYDPADCFECASPLPRWREWALHSPARRLLLILTREPSRAELQLLIVNRLHDTPWFATTANNLATPAVYAFIRGQQVDSAIGRVPSSAFFSRWVGVSQ